MKKKAICRALVSFLILAGPAGAEYELIHGPRASDPMEVHIYRLDNGLTVYLTENHQEPRFYAEIAVRAGSKHDPAEATGIAHYLEHMLFKGSDQIGTVDFKAEKIHLDSIGALYEQHFAETDSARRKALYALIGEQSQLAARYAIPNETQKVYSALGAKGLNAYTSNEETVYMVDLPANHLEQWAAMESERFGRPVFRLFQTEIEIVYEEKNRSVDNKTRLINEAVDRTLFKKHPYGQQTTLGSVEHLKNPSLKRMYEFYNTWYVPNNMAICISGDIDLGEAIAVVDRYFSGWQSKQLPKRRKWREDKLAGVERVEVRYPGEEMVRIAFRTAPSTHKDTEALLLVDMLLDNRTAGLVNINLNQKQRLRRAGATATSYLIQGDYGAQYLWGIPKQDQSLEEVEQLLLEQIELIKSGAFQAWVIPAIVTDFRKQYRRGLEMNGGRALYHRVQFMRHAFLSDQDWDDALGKLDRMAKLKKKDVVKVARRYFKDAYVVGFRRDGKPDLPSIEKPVLDPISVDQSRRSELAAQILAMPAEEIEPRYIIPGRDYKVKEIRDGVTLYYTDNPLNDLFSFTISIDVGLLADKRLAVAVDLMDKSGTPRFDSVQLKEEWYRLGTEFSMGTGDHETSITISGLEENFEASLSLLTELLDQPVTTDSTLRELVGIILAKREDAKKDHNDIRRALYRYNRHGDMSSHRRILDNESVRKLTVRELHDLVSGLRSYEHVLTYAGSRPFNEVQSALERLYSLSAKKLQEPPPFQPLEIRKPVETEIYFFDKEMAQSLVHIDSGDERYKESRRPAIQLYNEYFDGDMAAIVFQELRESRALAYRAEARYYPGNRREDPNILGAYIACQADKTPEAVEVFVDLIDNLPVSQERFAEALKAQINLYRTSHLGFRRVIDAVRQWERQGVAVDPRSWRLEQIQRADLDVVLDFHREHVANRPKLISIVGDKSKIDMEALARSGRIIEVGLEDIFGY